MNNDIEYGLFENVIDSYYLHSQMRDDFQCTKTCYTHDTTAGTMHPNPPCTHTYDHISQQLDSLADSVQQHTMYTNETDASLFTTDTATQCAFNITPSDLDTEPSNDIPSHPNNNTDIHFYSKHKYRETFGYAHIQYHDFDNGDALVHKDKYTALLQQELQNPYCYLHDPITTKSYQISSDMDIETMPHAMYFDGNSTTFTKINHIPYQTIKYNDKGMFPAQLMDDTPVQVCIDNGATPSILPLTRNILYYKNILQQKALHPSTQEVVQSNCTFG